MTDNNPTETEIPRQINASVFQPPISPIRIQRRGCLFLWRFVTELARSCQKSKFTTRRGANFLITLHFLSKVVQSIALVFIFCFGVADRGSSPAKHFIERLRLASVGTGVPDGPHEKV